MSYLDLNLSPRKKRRAVSPEDDGLTTPKRLRAAATSSSASSSKSPTKSIQTPLPPHLSRLLTIHASLQHALSVALATSATSPCTDTGRVTNVLNHLSLTTSMGFRMNCEIEDVKRLCWVWEWDGALPSEMKLSQGEGSPSKKSVKKEDEDDNPFIIKPSPPTDWTRGAMGFVITPTSHFVRAENKRLPAYGIGIEVEMDLAEDKVGGMAAVARWTSDGEVRKKEVEKKLREWAKLNGEAPPIPLADLPSLPQSVTKISSITRRLAESSSRFPSPTKSSPTKPGTPLSSAKRTPSTSSSKPFAVPFPLTPQTPSNRESKREFSLSRPPQTPSGQTGGTPPTPTTSRRAALYERIRLKSLEGGGESPEKAGSGSGSGNLGSPANGKAREKMKLLGQEETRRRLLLGRLEQVAATVWALFSNPAQTVSTPLSIARKRRTMQMDEVVRAVMSSSGVPISTGEEWVEMPASNPTSISTPPSPRSKHDSEHEVLHRSPKSVKSERGGLREVREVIRKEQEAFEI